MQQDPISTYLNRLLLFFMLSILIAACTSPLSGEKITDLSLINAEIEIIQSPGNKQDNTISVILRDKKGRRISNDSVIIIVNGVATSLSHRQGLYYTNESGYVLSDVPVNEAYEVKIKLPDQQTYFLGSVAALPSEDKGQITCSEVGDFNKDFIVSWKDLKGIDELAIAISELQKNSPPNEKNYSYRPEKVIKINPAGTYTIPKSSYITDSTIISGIEFDFRTTKPGKVNPGLGAGSKISISTLIEKNANFEE